jgi:hypothetical protein
VWALGELCRERKVFIGEPAQLSDLEDILGIPESVKHQVQTARNSSRTSSRDSAPEGTCYGTAGESRCRLHATRPGTGRERGVPLFAPQFLSMSASHGLTPLPRIHPHRLTCGVRVLIVFPFASATESAL